jgi:DNA-binding HxlR family transcriptional regulator
MTPEEILENTAKTIEIARKLSDVRKEILNRNIKELEELSRINVSTQQTTAINLSYQKIISELQHS